MPRGLDDHRIALGTHGPEFILECRDPGVQVPGVDREFDEPVLGHRKLRAQIPVLLGQGTAGSAGGVAHRRRGSIATHPAQARGGNSGPCMDERSGSEPAHEGPPGRTGRVFHASTNGDRWRLLRDPADGRSFVRHTGNPASGGHVTDLALAAFLAADRGGPEHRALWDLIGGLAGADDPTPPTAAA